MANPYESRSGMRNTYGKDGSKTRPLRISRKFPFVGHKGRTHVMNPLRKICTVALAVGAAGLIGTAAAPTADASVTTNYWWGKSTWYSQSEVKKLQPSFRRMADVAAGGGAAAALPVCAAGGLVAVVPGLACGAIVGAGAWYIQDQASKLDYAASRRMCARLDTTTVGIVTVTPYSCNWKK
ncbi:hypothetical protein [Rhodococcus opacus]|uniref:hypothetical protein n=1 Tax=Rhodococcus opacus TaxID=37919 RepID=UPI001F5A1AF1|nr:hypothetical protein [Rhodococcus opacus]UNN05219.1 hypothetical protein MOO23_40075 [Rhodococcus opacus]